MRIVRFLFCVSLFISSQRLLVVLSDPDSDEQHQAKRAKPPPKNKKTKSSRKSGTGGGFQMPSVLSADLQKVIPHQQVLDECFLSLDFIMMTGSCRVPR